MMKRQLITAVMICAVAVFTAEAQTVQQPWSAVTAGGSASATSGSLTLNGAVGPSGLGPEAASGGLALEGGYIPGLRVLAGATAALVQQQAAGWNMVSVPLLVPDYAKTTLYPGAVSNAFYYAGGYAVALTLQNGVGYWLQYTSATPEGVSGTAYASDTLAVLQNWNMIGPPSYPVLKSSIIANGTTIISNVFGYKAGFGYIVSDTLKPGSAYWVQVSANGSLVLPSGAFSSSGAHRMPASAVSAGTSEKPSALLSSEQAEAVKDFSVLAIRDADGTERSLYYERGKNPIDLSGYILPPVAPDGLLDVRFASQRLVEVAGGALKSYPVRLSGGHYPLTITWRGKPGSDKLIAVDGAGETKEYPLLASHAITVGDKSMLAGLRLVVDGAASAELPKAYALYQNYPNPFNPTTTIAFDLPKQSHVTLRLYSMLGAEVMTLVDEVRDAGRYTATVDGKGLASGVYFYRLQAGGRTMTKKMMLMK